MAIKETIALYARVSSNQQDTRSQEADLSRWVAAFAAGMPVRWYRDHGTGKTMNRPSWQQLEADMNAGQIAKIVVWRLDRLGRTASGLTALFERLQGLNVGLVSLKDSIDLETSAGRRMANVLASVAAYETEIRGERVLAGQAAARAQGKTWGGSKKGRRLKVNEDQISTITRLHRERVPVAQIARAVGLSRPTVYSVLQVSVEA